MDFVYKNGLDPLEFREDLSLDGVVIKTDFDRFMASLFLGNNDAIPKIANLLEKNKLTIEEYSQLVDFILINLSNSEEYVMFDACANAIVNILENFKRVNGDLTLEQKAKFVKIVKGSLSFRDFLINPNNAQVIPFKSNHLRGLLPELWQTHHQLKYLVELIKRPEVDDRRKAYNISLFCSVNESELVELSKKARLELLKDLLKIREWIAIKAEETPNSDDRITYVNAYGKLLRILQLYFSKSTDKLEKYEAKLNKLSDALRPYYES